MQAIGTNKLEKVSNGSLNRISNESEFNALEKVFNNFVNFVEKSKIVNVETPKILQSDNGKEFRNTIIEALKLLRPYFCIVHGRAQRPQTQGSVERSNGDVQNILGRWMRMNKSTKWEMALPIVQLIKNNKFHEGNKHDTVQSFIRGSNVLRSRSTQFT
ncbi:unnamed protein product [Brachionus calyciflorus]|uniref:Integrase catalytic domain-containing protein n=1 Tax=Brachionus calyciflorus TaxID=104777 RepID=A0A813LWA4_9BILA|nr:unnamed protein product [Brachionus calyciflorus]